MEKNKRHYKQVDKEINACYRKSTTSRTKHFCSICSQFGHTENVIEHMASIVSTQLQSTVIDEI